MPVVRRLLLSLGATLLVAAAMPLQPAGAVAGGTVDRSHPYVAAVLLIGAARPTCSGVWTAVGGGRRLVVTAAHCVPASRGAHVRVFFGQQWSAGAHTYLGRSYRHPSYDASTHRDDVAVILLSSDPHLSPATLAAYGSATGTSTVVVVGYGSPHPGQRRTATERVSGYSGWRLYLRPGSGNTCDGDSGGPDLRPGTHQVVALIDDGTCSRDVDIRLDTGSARSFVLGRH